jgi:outer membrane protein, heavy metal efflux system
MGRMKQTDTIPFLGLCLLLLLVSACAAVNPRPDYDRTAQLITQATGQELAHRPADDTVVNNKVAELLAGGITAHEAVQICLLNNPKLQAAFFNVGIAGAEVVQSRLFSNPSVALSPRFPDGGDPTSFEASFAQNIADLWLIPIRKRAAEHALSKPSWNWRMT